MKLGERGRGVQVVLLWCGPNIRLPCQTLLNGGGWIALKLALSMKVKVMPG